MSAIAWAGSMEELASKLLKDLDHGTYGIPYTVALQVVRQAFAAVAPEVARDRDEWKKTAQDAIRIVNSLAERVAAQSALLSRGAEAVQSAKECLEMRPPERLPVECRCPKCAHIFVQGDDQCERSDLVKNALASVPAGMEPPAIDPNKPSKWPKFDASPAPIPDCADVIMVDNLPDEACSGNRHYAAAGSPVCKCGRYQTPPWMRPLEPPGAKQ
jgi:hypothetical protein